MNQLIIKVIISFSLSFLIHYLLIKLSRKREFCIDSIEIDKPQRFHNNTTSRAGGVGIFIAFIICNLTCLFSHISSAHSQLSNAYQYSIFFSVFPAFLAGFYEDSGSHIRPVIRIIIMIIGSVLAMILLDSVVYDIGLFTLPQFLAIPFTIFAIVGVTNSINIIDGFNGLASGVALIALSSFATVSYIYGDNLIFQFSLILFFSILGFFVWNFPKGKIFLGDGGAYIIGFLLAIISILIVKRNPEISPWFPLTVLSYPVFETLFSIYRRKFLQKKSPFENDGLHLHTLIYRRITKNNPLTPLLILPSIGVFNIFAIIFHSYPLILIILFVLFSSLYISVYRRITRFKGGLLRKFVVNKIIKQSNWQAGKIQGDIKVGIKIVSCK